MTDGDSVFIAAMKRNKIVSSWDAEEYAEFADVHDRCGGCRIRNNLLYLRCDHEHLFVACDTCARVCENCPITYCFACREHGVTKKCAKCGVELCYDCEEPDSTADDIGLPKHQCRRTKSSAPKSATEK